MLILKVEDLTISDLKHYFEKYSYAVNGYLSSTYRENKEEWKKEIDDNFSVFNMLLEAYHQYQINKK